LKKYVAFTLVVILNFPLLFAQSSSGIRELRYRPDGSDFVINNGGKRFNRALYGTNTAFRVEAGDLPEFALYLPGMGGNLKFGLSDGKTSKWLIDSKQIEARYRPGSMIYSITDPMLSGGKLEIKALPLADAEGVIIRISGENLPEQLNLVVAFGGVTGKKFSRDGDLGADPESSFYLKPEYCTDNEYRLDANSFRVFYGSGRDRSEAERYENGYQPGKAELEVNRLRTRKSLTGVFPENCFLKVVDAQNQDSPESFLSSAANGNPALGGKLVLQTGSAVYFMLGPSESLQQPAYNRLPSLFEQAELHRQKVAGRIQIHTPDPYLNTVGGALSVAADAIWEEPSYLHGAIAWRMRLNGWRGAYCADVLGWHNRARMHFDAYAKAQYTEPASGPSVPDPKTNLARQEEKAGNALYTEGYISRNPDKISPPHHYDMNLVFIDQVLRHFNWTGDTAFLRKFWPVMERHLAWEKRCFDGNNDGLYDAYCCIWASDALQYSGGGVTHSSAYNYFANRVAAQWAERIGKNPKPYQEEAGRILSALNQQLWLPQNGWFAEYKDLLGLQQVHPSAALWTIYQAIDSQAADPFQAWQCLRYVDTEIPHIPVKAHSLPGNYYTLSTTNWMPYTWSINNVALGEVFQTALAYWQGGRNDEAFRILKSSLLDYMYLGSSPGNFGQLSYSDVFRGELYRDFADGIGVASRALVEGLFGIRPDAMNGKLLIQPGFPGDWKFASLKTPDMVIEFVREGKTDRYAIENHLNQALKLVLRVKAQSDKVREVWVNGRKTDWKVIADPVGSPELELTAAFSEKYSIEIKWAGKLPEPMKTADFYARGDELTLTAKIAQFLDVKDPQQVFSGLKLNKKQIKTIVSGETGNRTVFVKLQQGDLVWWQPINVEVRPAIEVISDMSQQIGMLDFKVRNNSANEFDGMVKVNGVEQALRLKAKSASSEIIITENFLMVGSNKVEVVSGNSIYTRNLINWKVEKNQATHYETVDLTRYFNDKVTQIFKNQYLSPRSPYPTLSIPTQGIGDWCSFKETEEIDDSGLRAKAGKSNRIILPQGIPLATPGKPDVSNILFTSRWDNYPYQAHVPLSGRASNVYLLMAGSTHHMQSRFDNGVVTVEYTDGTSEKLVLRNPKTWCPIEQDYYTNGLAFCTGATPPLRVYLKTGEVHQESYPVLNKNKTNKIEGGAATLLSLPLNPDKELKQLTLETLANDVVIGLMSLTLER
jgi:hypothetical protein